MSAKKTSKSIKPSNKARPLGTAKPKASAAPKGKKAATPKPRSGSGASKGAPAKAAAPKAADTKAKDQKAPPVRVVNEMRHLAMELTPSQIEERRHRLARVHGDIATEEAQLKSFKETSKARITSLEGQRDLIIKELHEEQVFDDVPCLRVHDYREKRIYVKRLDTKEEVESVPMTGRDLQVTIPGVDPTKEKSKDAESKKKAQAKLDAEADQAKKDLDAKAKESKSARASVSPETGSTQQAGEPPKCMECGTYYVKGLKGKLEVWVPNCDCSGVVDSIPVVKAPTKSHPDVSDDPTGKSWDNDDPEDEDNEDDDDDYDDPFDDDEDDEDRDDEENAKRDIEI